MDVTKERKSMNIPKQEYTAEFNELADKRVKEGQTIGVVARELGLVKQTLRNWVKAAAGKLVGAGAKVVTPEEMELSRLRAESIRLKWENGVPQPSSNIPLFVLWQFNLECPTKKSTNRESCHLILTANLARMYRLG
jgi:transposase